jgi:hypothetical protein
LNDELTQFHYSNKALSLPLVRPTREDSFSAVVRGLYSTPEELN